MEVVWFISEFAAQQARGANNNMDQQQQKKEEAIIRDTLKNQQYQGWKQFEGLEDSPEFEVWLGDEAMMEQQSAQENNVFHYLVGSDHWSLIRNKYDTLVIWGLSRDKKSSDAFERVKGTLHVHRQAAAQMKYNLGSNWPTKIVFAFQHEYEVPWDPKKKPCRSWRGKEPAVIRYNPYKIREFLTSYQQAIARAMMESDNKRAERKRKTAEAKEQRAKQRKLDREEANKILKG